MSIVGSIVGGIMGSHAANDAASVEQQGAKQAQQTIEKNQTNAVDAQDTALKTITSAEQPYQTLGSTSANGLNTLLGRGFTAPNPNDVASTPEYQFALSQGQHAIDSDAAAKGTLLSGNTGVALQNYGQGLASQQYQNAYKNAQDTFLTNYQSLLGGTTIGQNSTSQLAGANLTTAGNTANIDMRSGEDVAQQLNNAAAARAQGILGSNNALQGMIGGITSGVGNMDFSGGSSMLEMAGQFAGL